MRKLVLVFISVVVLIFLFITYSKLGLTKKVLDEKIIAGGTDKEKILSFWEFYRQATKSRIAGDWNSAIDSYRKALEINPDHEDALYYLGNMHLELKEFIKAEKAWKNLLYHIPASSRAHYQLGNIYLIYESSNLIDLDKAESEFRKMLEINKEETGPLLHLAKVYLLKGNHDLALEYFSAVIGSNFKSVESYFLSGFIAWKAGNSGEAQIMFEKAVKYSKPDNKNESPAREGNSVQGKNQNILFYAHIQELSNLNGINSSQEYIRRYKALETYLEGVKEKLDNNQ